MRFWPYQIDKVRFYLLDKSHIEEIYHDSQTNETNISAIRSKIDAFNF